jgi:predicted negative regulator of RcsB-dependent stress response
MKYAPLTRNQRGFETVGILFVVVILAVIGFTSYKVWSNSQAKPVASVVGVASTAASVPATITSKADLTKTSKALDSSSAQLNSQVNGDSLNGDITDLL